MVSEWAFEAAFPGQRQDLALAEQPTPAPKAWGSKTYTEGEIVPPSHPYREGNTGVPVA